MGGYMFWRSPSVSSNASSQTSLSSQSTITSSAVPLTVTCLTATLIAGLGFMTAGAIVAYASPAIADIDDTDSLFHLSEVQEAWFGSLTFLGSFCGSLFAGFLMDNVGRKFVIMLMAFPVVVGWEIIIASKSVTAIFIGRALTGFGRGILLPSVHVYIAEIAPASMRGTLLAVAALSNALGNLFEYVLGTALQWNWLALGSMAIPTVLCVLMCIVPESPRFLVQSGRLVEAESIMLKLRDNSDCIINEMQEMEDNVKNNDADLHLFKRSSFFLPPLRKPLLIALAVFGVKELSGTSYVRTYAVSINHEAGMTSYEANTQSIVFGLVGVGGVLVSCVANDRVGRRTILITSCCAMTICLAAIGAYFKVLDNNKDYALNNLYWLSPISLVLNNFSFALAFDSIPWLIVSEMFPTRARGTAHSIIGCWENFLAFLVTFLLSIIGKKDGSDNYWGYFCCSLVCLIGTIVIFFVVPETKKETLENIQSKFHQSSSSNDVIEFSTHM